MREVQVQLLSDAIQKMVQDINFEYPQDVQELLLKSEVEETSAIGKQTLSFLRENARIAKEERIPICQDTGMVIVFMRVGQEVHFVGGNVKQAINEGVAKGYEEGYLRKSVVSDPLFDRINTKDNTPCVIYTDIVEGSRVEIEVSTKGFGSENMSTITMLKPAQGIDGVKEAVLSTIKNAGPNACPPMLVGVGIGGTFDYAAVLAKKATLRDARTPHEDLRYAKLEEELLTLANALQIGPQGLKGDTTALKINIESFPTHIAGLPCAVNISCHVTRHAKEVL